MLEVVLKDMECVVNVSKFNFTGHFDPKVHNKNVDGRHFRVSFLQR